MLEHRLTEEGLDFELTRVETRPAFLTALASGKFDIILSDYTIPGFGGREALLITRQQCPELPYIFFSGTIGEERAIECLKIGAADFVLKDQPSRLGSAVRRALETSEATLQRKEAERALHTREAQYRVLVEQSMAGVYIIQDGRWIYVNPVLASILGRTPESIIDRPLLEIIVPEDRPLVEQNIQKRLSGTVSSLRYQLRMLHKNGTYVDVEVHGSSTQYEGRPAIMGVLLDITERKRKEEQIREQAALLDKALNAIMVRDLFGCIRYWNEGARRLYGWTAKEALGQNADSLLFKGDSSEATKAHAQVAERGEWSGDFKQVTRDGKEISVESHWSLIRDDAGQPKSILVVNNDVTEKKKIDAQVRRTQRLDSIGALAGGIAHDLNNVLSPILMALSLLKDQAKESDHKLLDMLEGSCRRGAEMVKQILLFARGAEGERAVMQLNKPLAELVKILRQMFTKSIKIEMRPAENLWPVLGDATQLHQVFMNLCVNARDAMPDGGLLRIETANTTLDELEARMFGEAKPGPYVLVTIADTGTGIPPEIMEKIFEPFFTTKEIGKGTGLGLSTVAGIVKGQGGFVKVYSEIGRGTSFRVYLPAMEPAMAVGAGVQAAEVPRGHGEKILLVDDELTLREITKAALEKHGYEVAAAADGAEAIALYAQSKDEIAVVITDMTMPVMDGPATIRALKRIKPGVKVIAVSGLMVDLKAAHVEASENVRFLAKPFDTEKILVTLREMIAP